MITLRLQTRVGQTRLPTKTYKTIAGARRFAQSKLGKSARLDPDGYAVGRGGNYLFFDGCEFSDLWPPKIPDEDIPF